MTLSSNHILFELIRSSVFDVQPSIPNNVKIDWDEMMNIASEQGTLAWVYDSVCKLPSSQQLSRAEKVSWGLSAQEIWDRYARHQEVLGQLIELCGQQEIRVLLLKGIGISKLYPKPESRPSGDIDIFLFDDFEKGNKLLANGDPIFDKKHTEFEFEGALIENHITPLDTDTPQRRKVNEFLVKSYDNAVMTGGGYYVFEPIAGLVYLLSHTVRHFSVKNVFPFRSIVDIFMYCNTYSDKISPKTLYNVLKDLQLLGSFELLLLLGETILGRELPQYHFGTISAKDQRRFRRFLENEQFSFPDTQSLNWSELIRGYWKRYMKVNTMLSYLPYNKFDYFFDIVRFTVVVTIKRIIGMPDNQHLWNR